jgi:hypothetical protein
MDHSKRQFLPASAAVKAPRFAAAVSIGPNDPTVRMPVLDLEDDLERTSKLSCFLRLQAG